MDLDSPYYSINAQREEELWKKGVFVFDSSALLNFYEYSDETRVLIFKKIFKDLKGRLWIPNYVEREFLRNRESTLKKPHIHYDQLKSLHLKAIEENFTQIKNKTKKNDRHPFLDSKIIEAFDDELQKFKDKINSEIEKQVKGIEKIAGNDTILKNLETTLKIGDVYSYSQLIEISKEGEFRYKHQIPPGYKDEKDKTGFDIFGDLIIWKQILDYAKTNKKPIVFITDDRKEDWWVLSKSREIERPREELVHEMLTEAKVDFWMYDSGQFLDKTKRILKTDIKEEVIEEVRSKSHKFYGFTYDHAFYLWLVEKYESHNFISRYANRTSDTNMIIDYVVTDDSLDILEGFVLTYVRESSIRVMRIRIRNAISDLEQLLADGYSPKKISLVFGTSGSDSAQRIIEEIRKVELWAPLYKFIDVEIDFIIGYSKDQKFIEFATINMKKGTS